MHVVFEGLLRELGVRVHPGNDEHGEPLRDRPADVAFLRDEVEDVELVDPRRHDEQRPLEHLFRARAVLDELDELVLEDDLAGRDRQVLPTSKADKSVWLMRSRSLDCSRSWARCDMPCTRFARVGSERGAHHFRIGQRRSSTARTPRASARDRTGHASCLVVHAFGLAGEVLGPARGQQIGLLPEIEERVFDQSGSLKRLSPGSGSTTGFTSFSPRSGAPSAPKARRSP